MRIVAGFHSHFVPTMALPISLHSDGVNGTVICRDIGMCSYHGCQCGECTAPVYDKRCLGMPHKCPAASPVDAMTKVGQAHASHLALHTLTPHYACAWRRCLRSSPRLWRLPVMVATLRALTSFASTSPVSLPSPAAASPASREVQCATVPPPCLLLLHNTPFHVVHHQHQ